MSDAVTKRFVDLSHTVEHGMITYPGLPAPTVSDFLSRQESRAHYSPDTEFHIGRIEMVANTGTYLDTPFHRYPEGRDLSELPLEAMADLEGVVIRVLRSERAIGTEPFNGLDLCGKAVLVETGWSAHWATERYLSGHPYLTEGAALRLVAARAALVGIDSLNIDDTNDGRRPVHSLLLRAGIPIVEHMTGLSLLPARGFRFFAVPVKVKGLGSFPVRAFAQI